MKDYCINIFYSDEDDGYIADIPDLVLLLRFRRNAGGCAPRAEYRQRRMAAGGGRGRQADSAP